MDPKLDLLQVALQRFATHLLGHFLAAFTTVLQALLGFDPRSTSRSARKAGR